MAYAVLKSRKRLLNPGSRKRRKMSAKQIAIFGTKRQKAALKRHRPARKKNASVRKLRKGLRRSWGKAASTFTQAAGFYRAKGRKTRAAKKRKRNVGSILVASIPGNPGERKSMARARKRRRTRRAVVHHRRRRRSNPVARRTRHRRRSNPVYVSSRRRYSRRRNVSHRRGRRRNPGMGIGEAKPVVGILAGVAATRLLVGFVPAQFNSGIAGYVATGVIAIAQGRMLKKWFGPYATYGGLALLFARVINDFLPSVGGYIGISGLGVVSPTAGFFSPQVPKWGTMGSYIAPGTITSAIASSMAAKSTGMHGLGATNMSARRVGRIQ